ncbi:MAG: hypothetical protein WBV46_19780, partial [Terriglobales bacterium]
MKIGATTLNAMKLHAMKLNAMMSWPWRLGSSPCARLIYGSCSYEWWPREMWMRCQMRPHFSK